MSTILKICTLPFKTKKSNQYPYLVYKLIFRIFINYPSNTFNIENYCKLYDIEFIIICN